jgi:hypothetical protein
LDSSGIIGLESALLEDIIDCGLIDRTRLLIGGDCSSAWEEPPLSRVLQNGGAVITELIIDTPILTEILTMPREDSGTLTWDGCW